MHVTHALTFCLLIIKTINIEKALTKAQDIAKICRVINSLTQLDLSFVFLGKYEYHFRLYSIELIEKLFENLLTLGKLFTSLESMITFDSWKNAYVLPHFTLQNITDYTTKLNKSGRIPLELIFDRKCFCYLELSISSRSIVNLSELINVFACVRRLVFPLLQQRKQEECLLLKVTISY